MSTLVLYGNLPTIVMDEDKSMGKHITISEVKYLLEVA